jgi:hypothetical protein
MRKRQSNTQGLCDALNALGIKTSIPEGFTPERNLVLRALRVTEKARRVAAKEIDRISGKAKRLTSR